jgi:anti-sigma factor RsiW
VRCSWCEPVLDAFLEGTLSPRKRRGVVEHLRRCESCAALLAELRVVDALLATAQWRAEVPTDFTVTVVAATSATPPQVAPRRSLPWLPLAIYLVVAWGLAAAVQLQGRLAGGFFAALDVRARAAGGALGAALHVFAPVTPLAAAAVTAILAVDLLLLAALIFGYRRVRPLLAFHLARGNQQP